MKHKHCLALVAIAVSASSSAAPVGEATRTTTKGVEPFAQCFAAAQDRASRPWSFVPEESGGGTFSDLGARGVRQPYFLEVADRGAHTQVRLTPAADSAVMRAVNSCI